MSEKQFKLTSLIFGDDVFITESSAPDWLTGEHTRLGSTMDCRWFWNDHVLALDIGQHVDTDFHRITRVS